MFTEDDLYAAAKEIAEINDLPLELAEELMACIGDTPEINEEGKVVA